jgi:hypothetical protein
MFLHLYVVSKVILTFLPLIKVFHYHTKVVMCTSTEIKCKSTFTLIRVKLILEIQSINSDCIGIFESEIDFTNVIQNF